MKKLIYISLIIITIAGGIALGVVVHLYNDEKMEKVTIDQVKEAQKTLLNKTVIQTATQEKKSSPNAYITFETYYTKCGHSEISKKRILPEDANMTEEELKEKYKEYNLKIFTDDEIIFYRELNEMCNNHFIIKEKDNRIAIYNIDKEGNEILKNTTDIETKYLPEEDVKLLQRGIKANSQNELQQILSDYE